MKLHPPYYLITFVGHSPNPISATRIYTPSSSRHQPSATFSLAIFASSAGSEVEVTMLPMRKMVPCT